VNLLDDFSPLWAIALLSHTGSDSPEFEKLRRLVLRNASIVMKTAIFGQEKLLPFIFQE
jgi:hypothetical protein